MTERTKVAVLKTAVGFTPYRGFESHSLRRVFDLEAGSRGAG